MQFDPETVTVVANSVFGCGIGGFLIWAIKKLKNKKQVSLRWHTVDKDDKPHTTEVTINRS